MTCRIKNLLYNFCSPAWISLTRSFIQFLKCIVTVKCLSPTFYSPDPILTAFRLSRELQKRAKAEDEFKDAYMQLAGTIQTLIKYKLELIKPQFGILKNRNLDLRFKKNRAKIPLFGFGFKTGPNRV